MDPSGSGASERLAGKFEDGTEGGVSFPCDLCDVEIVRKIAQAFLPGLATACVDNTKGDIFRSPGSVAADLRNEMADYLTHRSENFVAERVVLDGDLEAEVSHNPYDIISDFIDDFAIMKRNWFIRVSGWLLSERREDDIDDFAQEMEINGFWPMDPRERVAQTLLRNVDYKNVYHCNMKFNTKDQLREHVEQCWYRSIHCDNEGCNSIFCACQAEKHDSFCPFKIIRCEQNCSSEVLRREMDRHCITVCPMRIVNCPIYSLGCPATIPQCKIEEHCSDELRAHLTYVLRKIYREASLNFLETRAEQIEKSFTRLGQARDARSFTRLVSEFDSKLGPAEIHTKNIGKEASGTIESSQVAENKELDTTKAVEQQKIEDRKDTINIDVLKISDPEIPSMEVGCSTVDPLQRHNADASGEGDNSAATDVPGEQGKGSEEKLEDEDPGREIAIKKVSDMIPGDSSGKRGEQNEKAIVTSDANTPSEEGLNSKRVSTRSTGSDMLDEALRGQNALETKDKDLSRENEQLVLSRREESKDSINAADSGTTEEAQTMAQST